jgi:phage baseplate assembly protein W
MSWSLKLTNGDISYGTNGLSTVTGSNKLGQDMACAVLTPIGSDPTSPTYGSAIDGGLDQNGNALPSLIGSGNTGANQAFISAEIQRVLQNYQAAQLQRYQNDVAAYGRSTLSAGEALLSINQINTQPVDDQLIVTAVVTTGNGSLTVNTLLA